MGPRAHTARLLGALTCLALLLFLLLPGIATAGLKDRIGATLKRYGMAGRGTSVAVYDLTARRVVYQLRPDVLRLPASNEKLVTSAAALISWTSSFRFSTQLFLPAVGVDEEGVVRGDVYLRGLGDATLSTASFQARHYRMKTGRIEDMVAGLQALGVTHITGSVVADDGYFDDARSVSTWRPSMIAYCGPLSALTVNESVTDKGDNVRDPSLAAARALTTELRAAGIRVVHMPVRGVAPIDATLTLTERSATLGRVLAAMNKPSDNFLAEELLKGLGASFGEAGSTLAGAAVAADVLTSLGVGDDFRLRDGSGLSYRDRLTARTILRLLSRMAKRSDFDIFRRSLAVAGVDGTLKDRLRDTVAEGNVRAKTGTLDDASCLSGYVTTANRHRLAFAMLMNGDPVATTKARAAQDAVALLLARSSP